VKEIHAIIRPERLQATQEVLYKTGVDTLLVYDALGRGREAGMSTELGRGEEGLTRVPFLKKRMVSFICPARKVQECLRVLLEVNQSGRIGDGKIFVSPVEVKK